MNEALGASANVTIDIRDAATGRLVDQIRRHNLVTAAGCNLIRDLLNGTSTKYITHVGVGSGTVPVDTSDTALHVETHRGEVTSRVAANGLLTLQLFINSAQANGPISEAGLFNAATGGDLFAHVVFPVFIKSTSLTVTLTWDITLAAAS